MAATIQGDKIRKFLRRTTANLKMTGLQKAHSYNLADMMRENSIKQLSSPPAAQNVSDMEILRVFSLQWEDIRILHWAVLDPNVRQSLNYRG